jgi:hypothetical protein
MRLLTTCLLLAAMIAVWGATSTAEAGGRTRTHNDIRARRFAFEQPWHGPYYHREYGAPVALVVPPTASAHTQWSWGVAQTHVMPTYHQFGRAYPGGVPGEYLGPLYPTPAWPSHTDQFGVYPVRGPW